MVVWVYTRVSLKYLVKANELSEKYYENNSPFKSVLCSNIGFIYNQLNNHKKSVDYYIKLTPLIKGSLDSSMTIIIIYQSLISIWRITMNISIVCA